MKLAHILLDMDGVLCDFTGPALRLHGKEPEAVYETWPAGEYDIAKALGISTAAFWSPINKAGFEWWASLPVLPWALDLFVACKEIAPTIVASSPSWHPASFKGKALWMHKNLGNNFRDYLLGPAKHACARPDHVLIDDCVANCEKFSAHGGQVILFPRIWNHHHERAGDPIKHVTEQLARFAA